MYESWSEGTHHMHTRAAYGDYAMNDPILDEIRQYREAYAASFNYDLDAMYADIKKREDETKKRIQDLSSRTAQHALPCQSIDVAQASSLPVKRAS